MEPGVLLTARGRVDGHAGLLYTQHVSETIASVADEIAGRCLCWRVRALSRRITAQFDEALRHFGMTGNQLTVLVSVRRQGTASVSSLAERLEMDKSTVSRTVSRMVEQGWLATQEGPGRQIPITITEEGDELIRKAAPHWRRVQSRTEAALGEELSSCLRALKKVPSAPAP